MAARGGGRARKVAKPRGAGSCVAKTPVWNGAINIVTPWEIEGCGSNEKVGIGSKKEKWKRVAKARQGGEIALAREFAPFDPARNSK
jgi:hypothetical protein